MSRIICSGSEPSMITVFQCRLFEVVAGNHRGMRLAQLLGQRRLAFEADPQRSLGQARQREDLAGHLEHRVLRPERERLLAAEKRQTVIAKLQGGHWFDCPAACAGRRDGAPCPCALRFTIDLRRQSAGGAGGAGGAGALVSLVSLVALVGPGPGAAAAAPGRPDSGVRGIVLYGPTCPVQRAGQSCERPYQATIVVRREPSNGSSSALIPEPTDASPCACVPGAMARAEQRHSVPAGLRADDHRSGTPLRPA